MTTDSVNSFTYDPNNLDSNKRKKIIREIEPDIINQIPKDACLHLSASNFFPVKFITLFLNCNNCMQKKTLFSDQYLKKKSCTNYYNKKIFIYKISQYKFYAYSSSPTIELSCVILTRLREKMQTNRISFLR